jgi:putative restriction endonuclease
VKGIFDTKRDSGYDDDITRRYHFPSQYRPIAETIAGDWIIYREPRRNNGREAYVAVARIARIDSDPVDPSYAYAVVTDFLPFDEIVPLKSDGVYAEAALRSIGDPSRVGAYLQGKSIREIALVDFATIVRKGLANTLDPANARRLNLDTENLDPETLALVEAPIEEQERRIVSILVNRKIRDASFRDKICDAYGDRCAVTVST